MRTLSEPMLYWHTVRHLRRTQIVGRVAHVLRSRFTQVPPAGPVPEQRPVASPFIRPVALPASMRGPQSFVFLDEDGDVASAADWNDAARARLWLYNLHYFADLAAEAASERAAWHRALMTRWIRENPAARGVGWEAYPISLRIVNWIKWALAGNRLDGDQISSLAQQARHLQRHIEWHLLGNHTWANGKALVFAGTFLAGAEADEWRRRGLQIVARQLDEQVLGDGGHFERSPMYHAIVLEDVLDLINLDRCYGLGDQAALATRLEKAARAMRFWLARMIHPDGEIAFFNDAASGIAPTAGAIESYATRLGLAAISRVGSGLDHLAATGYVRLARGDAVAWFDAGAVGPDYLPGHAHADTLSIELSIGAERIVVNGGTSVYGTGPERQRQRSTAAHSTVEVDGESSSEVWGGFRCARRARILRVDTDTSADAHSAAAAHDGYKRLPGRNVHSRRVELASDRLAVEDRLSGSYGAAVARFHLGDGVIADIAADRRSGTLASAGGRIIAWQSSTPARIAGSTWHPRFGVTYATQCLCVPLIDGRADTVFAF